MFQGFDNIKKNFWRASVWDVSSWVRSVYQCSPALCSRNGALRQLSKQMDKAAYKPPHASAQELLPAAAAEFSFYLGQKHFWEWKAS